MYYLKYLPLTSPVRKRLLKMEQSVLDNASTVLAVTPLVQDDFRRRTSAPVPMITNGYDEEDYDDEYSDGYDDQEYDEENDGQYDSSYEEDFGPDGSYDREAYDPEYDQEAYEQEEAYDSAADDEDFEDADPEDPESGSEA